eukprot:SAG31_NODE_613_length_13545_cov_10.972557_11_plen_251_part_00
MNRHATGRDYEGRDHSRLGRDRHRDDRRPHEMHDRGDDRQSARRERDRYDGGRYRESRYEERRPDESRRRGADDEGRYDRRDESASKKRKQRSQSPDRHTSVNKREVEEDSKWGLKVKNGSSKVAKVAPSIKEMLKEKEERDAQAKAAKEAAEKRRRRGPLSAEDRAKRLAEMQGNAVQADESKQKRLQDWNKIDEQLEKQEQGQHTGNGKFLDDVQSKAYGSQMGANVTLGDAINRRAHMRQSRSDALS